jgi:bisphosphoglycerate-independent phosphoglycerate mutase (AlkP superfamily)
LLRDIIPALLNILNIEEPKEMTGRDRRMSVAR